MGMELYLYPPLRCMLWFKSWICRDSNPLSSGPGPRDEQYARWPVVISIQFFCGPSAHHQCNGNTILHIFNQWQCNGNFFGGPLARHQYNGNTISIFSTDGNVMAIFWRASGPPSIQWQHNFPCPVLSAQFPVYSAQYPVLSAQYQVSGAQCPLAVHVFMCQYMY